MGREVPTDSGEDASEFQASQARQAPAHPQREKEKK